MEDRSNTSKKKVQKSESSSSKRVNKHKSKPKSTEKAEIEEEENISSSSINNNNNHKRTETESKQKVTDTKRRKKKETPKETPEPVEMSEPAPKKSVTRKEKKREKKREKEQRNKEEEEEEVEEKEELNPEDFEDKLSKFEEALLDKMATEAPSESTDALRGLLSKLSHPSQSFAPNPLSRSKLNSLLTGLKSQDEAMQLQCLIELCDFLSIGTEENMSGFSVDSFAPALIELLNMEHNPDMMLLACRALSYIMEALPQVSGALVGHQAVPALCNKLLNIEYIDLAEQALQCLEKISYENPSAILSAGGLMAVLMFLDFFPTGTQRTALNTAANICRSVPPASYDTIADAIPILTNITTYPDSKLAEKAILCFTRLADSFYGTDKVEKLAQHGLLQNLVHLVSIPPGGTGISPGTYTLVIRLLSNLCYASPSIVQTILQEGEGLSSILQNALTSNSGSSSEGSQTPATPMSSEQLYEILSLINEIMPTLPKDFTVYLNSGRPLATANLFGIKTSGKIPFFGRKKQTEKVPEEESEEEPEEANVEESSKKQQKKPESDPRLALLHENPKLLVNFGERLLSPLMQVFTSTINITVKYKCLLAITKLLYFSTADMLRDLLKNLAVSSFVATLLASQDLSIVATAVKMCEVLMEKLPDIFDVYFQREGVVHEIERLANFSLPPEKMEIDNTSDVESFIKTHAQQFKEKYFSRTATETNISNQLKALKAAVTQLGKGNDKSTLEDIARVLGSQDNVSTFEFLSSGVVESLLSYLTTNEDGRVLVERAVLLCNVFLQNKEETPFLTLVQKLHQALNKLEKFPVVLHHELAGNVAGLKFLTQPFKLKLQKDPNETNLKEFGDNVILIEPMASVQAISDYLATRVKPDLKDSTSKLTKSSDSVDTMEIEEPTPQPTQIEEKEREFLDDDYEEEEEEEEEDEEEEEEEVEEYQQPPIHDVTSVTPEPQSLKLVLSINGEVLRPSMTMFQVMQTMKKNEEDNVHKLWDSVHLIQYRVADTAMSIDVGHSASFAESEPYLSFLRQKFESPIDTPETVHKVLSLLRILYELNTSWSQLSNNKALTKHFIVPPTEFVNNKITAKLTRQLQDIVSLCGGALPEWAQRLPISCFFLFPFETRKLYFACTSFGIARALQAIQQYNAVIGGLRASTEIRIGRIQRQKVRISRQRILEAAMKVMELYAKNKAILEVEYFDEVGTGLGPTLEFYTLVSQEVQRKDLNLWRDEKPKSKAMEVEGKKEEGQEEETKSFVFASGGLFPAPRKLDIEKDKKILDLFKFLGAFVGKALLDNRLIDLPLSTAFFKVITGKKLSFADLKEIDGDLGASIDKMNQVVNQIHEIQLDSTLSQPQKQEKIENLQLSGVSIEDLGLDFTFPGQPNWELKANGSQISVTIHNLEEYVNLLIEGHLSTGVSLQFDAFKRGFNDVFSINNLAVFTTDDLDTLLCGHEEPAWDMQTLIENTRCDHGYSHSSQVVKDFLEILTEFNPEERRKFLLFVTGSPRLPVGGFKSLEPKLTIVRKEHGNDDPDTILPSVNCCFYYLKLPVYSSKKKLKEKLMFAIEHGQGSFSFN